MTTVVEEMHRLEPLLDTAPAEAIAAARGLPDTSFEWKLLRAKVLCDGGAAIADKVAIADASEIFEDLYAAHPKHVGTCAYNLANAIDASAYLDGPFGPDWFLRTAQARRRARSLYGESAHALRRANARHASTTLTNLGSTFEKAHRWVEALDCYYDALEVYPRNGAASGRAARVLFSVAKANVLGSKDRLLDVAHRLAHHAKTNRATVVALAGAEAAKRFSRLPSRAGPHHHTKLGPRASKYMRFVAENRLFLSPVVEGVAGNWRRWDDAHVYRITEDVAALSGTPPIIAMFNVMKADYLTARELLFRGVSEQHRDTGLYFDTLDYAVYGVRTSTLVLAQRAALDILDKVAVALNEHFNVGEQARGVTFQSFWREKPNLPHWKPKLAAAIERHNPALIALSEIAADLTDGSQDNTGPGVLNSQKRARHAGTHRFAVLHETNMRPSRESPSIEHYGIAEFNDIALRTVKLARAALLYFLEAIEYPERALEDARPEAANAVSTLLLPLHHQIRGER